MITISRHDDLCDWMLMYANVLIGPFQTDGFEHMTTSTFRHWKDFLHQMKGDFGENDVHNRQVMANLVMSDACYNITSLPLADRPQRVTMTLKGSNGVKQVIDSPYGYFMPGKGALVERTSSRLTHLGLLVEGNTWSVYMVSTSVDGRKVYSWKRNSIKINSFSTFSTSGMERSVESYNRSSGYSSSIDWTRNVPAGVIASMKSLFSSSDRASSTLAGATIYRLFSKGSPSLTSAYDSVDDVVRHIDAFQPHQEMVDFGTLADEAVRTYIGNDVNVLEFLSDIRHPKELLLKLKNLRHILDLPKGEKKALLKKASGGYLSVKFGVLPTISDVKSLWSTFDRMRPYYDKNGFQTVHSGFSGSIAIDSVAYSMTYRLKIAIDNLESSFKRCNDVMDRLGVLPNAENLWDLIPYSFVADWITPAGDFLEAICGRQKIGRYNIRYTTSSKRVSATQSVGDPYSRLQGVVTVVSYHRWTSRQCPLPPLLPQFSTDGSSHWLEASALILQRH